MSKEDNKDRIIACSTVLCFIFFFALLFLGSYLQIYVRDNCSSLYQLMLSQSLPLFQLSSIKIDIFGFCIPFAVSIIFAILAYRFRPSFPKLITLLFILGILLSAVLPTYIPILQYVQINVGAGINWATIFVIILYIFYINHKGTYKFNCLISYPLGFIIGAISDISGLLRLSSSATFGGAGIVDGDFMFPIFLFFSVTISSLIIKYWTHRTMQK
jgi:hypothetical protein